MNSRTPARLLIAVIGIVMAWQAHHVLDTASLLVCWDLPGHLLRAHNGFSSWFPFWHGGFPLTEVYPPLATWLLGLLGSVRIENAASRTDSKKKLRELLVVLERYVE